MREEQQPDFDTDRNEETHPAFGIATIVRTQGDTSLFQSDLRHNNTLTLRIHKASRKRDLNHDWVHPEDEILEVQMSTAQWGELISAIGVGSGVPVTLRRHNGKRLPDIPHQPRVAENLREVGETTAKTFAEVAERLVVLEEAIEQKKGIKATRAALRDVQFAVANAGPNAKHAVKSLMRASEKVVTQATADIEAQILHAQTAHSLDAPIETPELEGST